jgi:hypothetical protein
MKPTTPDPQDRKPGRSFDDGNRPLGQELLEHSSATATPIKEDFTKREVQAATTHGGVAERAKAIAVLRKAEELFETDNPGPHTEKSLHRALELAAGRVGLTIGEYNALVKGDPELVELERKVLASARSRFA